MIAPIATLRPKTLQARTNISSKAEDAIKSAPRRSEMAVAVEKVLKEAGGNPDNYQNLKEINALVTKASSEELNSLIDALPDSALKQWVKEIQKDALPNSGLSADQRKEFFSLLVQELSPAQTDRWQSLLPESLQDEFSNAVSLHRPAGQEQSGSNENSQGDGQQDALFLLGNTVGAPGQQVSLPQGFTARSAPQDSSTPVAQETSTSTTATTPSTPETQAIVDAIDTLAPNATKEVKQQLVDAYVRVKTEMTLVGTPGNDSKALARTIQETNNLFREHGLGNLLPADKRGNIELTYNSDTLPPELNMLKYTGVSKGVEFGDKDWSTTTNLVSLPPNLQLKAAERLLAKPLSQADEILHEERGFALPENIDEAVTSLEQTLFSSGVVDTDALLSNMQALDAQAEAEGGTAQTRTIDGETYISAQLLRFNQAGNEPIASAGNQNWINTTHLSTEQLLAAADQQRTDVLSARLDETGTSDLDAMVRGIQQLNPEITEQQSLKLANQYLKLQRSIQVTERHPELTSNILENLTETRKLQIQLGLPTFLPAPIGGNNNRIRFDSDTLPSELSGLKSITIGKETEFGDSGWYADVNLGSLSPALLAKFAKAELELIPHKAAVTNLSQIDQFEGHAVSHTPGIQAMMDSAQPIPDGTSTANEPVLGELLQVFDSKAADPKSEGDYRSLADTSYLIASSLLTDSANGMSQEELLSLESWIDGASLNDLGFETTREIGSHQDDNRIEQLGEFGNFGEDKYRFAQAWLNSSKEERLDYFGIDAGRWSQAQPYIRSGWNADWQAREIKRAEFGVDDAIKVVAAIVISTATAGAASNAMAGLFAPASAVTVGGTTTYVAAGALAGTVSATTASFLTAAAGAAAAGFSSTFVMTEGDIEESLKSGLMGAITGGLGEYAGSLKGATGLVAQAVVQGVQNELSGKDFLDGVLASVAQNFGAGVASRLKNHMPEFVAGFAGKATEVAIRTGGDKDLMQQELEQYVINFVSGQATSRLTAVLGEDYENVTSSLGDLAKVVIDSGGDMNKVKEYLKSDEFYASLGDDIGTRVTDHFGGKEKFSAAMFGKITNIVVASRGDMDVVADNIGGLALSVMGDWAGNQLSTQLGGVLGETEGGLSEALGSLANVAIASGWDTNAINAYMNGPLLASLGTEVAGLIPERFGGPGKFLGKSLERLTQSYAANNGDMDAVAKDMAEFLLDEAVDFIEQAESNKPLSLGDTGKWVEKAQAQLKEHGYLDNASGTFDDNTADAVSRFQQDQIEHLTATLSTETNITIRSMINDQLAAIKTEHDAGKIDITTRTLLDSPYTTANSAVQNNDTNSPGDLTADWKNAPMIDLGMGSTGPGVTRLQNVLTDLGYDLGTVDGIFGEKTATALNQFQQDQLELLQNKLPDVSRTDQPEFYNLLTQLGGDLVVEQSQDKTGELTAKLLVNPITSEMLYDPAINDVLDIDSLRTTLTDADALAYFQSFDAESSGGFIQVNNTEVNDTGDQRQRLLSLIDWMASNDGFGTSIDNALSEMTPQQWNSVGKTLDLLTPDELEDFANYLTPSLTSDELAQVFEGASTRSRIAVVQAAKDVGNDELRGQFANMTLQTLVDQYDKKGELSDEDKVLMQEVGQLLSIPGSPTWNLAVGALFGNTQKINEVQYAIDFLDLKAKAKLEFTGPEKTFLKDLFAAFEIGGRVEGYTEAANLVAHYIDGNGENLSIDSKIYETSQIVKDTTAAMLEHIQNQEKSGHPVGQLSTRDSSFRNSEHIRSVMLINGSRDTDSQGYVQSDGLVVAEQGNLRLKKADNRFTITSNTIRLDDGTFETTFSVANTYDFEKYEVGNKVTELPLGAESLGIPDGLSEYMDSGLGIARPFEYEAQWTVRWS